MAISHTGCRTLIILILVSPIAAQDLDFRLGARYGTYQKALTFSASTRLGAFRLYNSSMFEDERRSYSTGIQFTGRPFTLGVFAYNAGTQTRLNFTARLDLGRTMVMAAYREYAESGNLNVSHRFKSGLIVRASATISKLRNPTGQIEISFPVRISLGKKRERPPIQGREIETSAIDGQLSIPMANALVLIQGPERVSMMTNDEGRFRFQGILPGRWRLEVRNLPLKYVAEVLFLELEPLEEIKVVVTLTER